MKGIRLKIMLLTALMLMICCGLMFYRSLFSLDVPKTVQQLDFDELRSLDLQINASAFYLRKNINSDANELAELTLRINELLAIINDMNNISPEMSLSVNKVKTYFKTKQDKLERFQKTLKELRTNINLALPRYNELAKSNVKFSLDKNDKRDFFKECLLDVYMYMAFSHKENETRVQEDLKILSQVVNYVDSPNPLLVNYYNALDSIHKSVRVADQLIIDFKKVGIGEEMSVISKSYMEESMSRERNNETFLKLIFASFVFYLLAMVVILRKN
jgi:hypothetical protein